jgi:hypothetical protein
MTLRRTASALLAIVLLAPSALAEGSGGHGGSSGAAVAPTNRVTANFTLPSDIELEAQAKQSALDAAGEVGPQVIEIPTLTLPSFVGDELKGYFFVSVRVILKDGVDPWGVREKSHIVRDAMIRVGHTTSVADQADPRRVDVERARRILSEGLARVVPLAEVAKLEILGVDSPAT